MENLEPLCCWFSHRVSYRETDAMGIVYYAEYLHFFERARTEYIRNILSLSYSTLEKQGYFLPVSYVECKYRNPIHYDALIHIKTFISQCKRASLTFTYEIFNEEKTLLHASGLTILACTNTEGKPQKLPAILL